MEGLTSSDVYNKTPTYELTRQQTSRFRKNRNGEVNINCILSPAHRRRLILAMAEEDDARSAIGTLFTMCFLRSVDEDEEDHPTTTGHGFEKFVQHLLKLLYRVDYQDDFVARELTPRLEHFRSALQNLRAILINICPVDAVDRALWRIVIRTAIDHIAGVYNAVVVCEGGGGTSTQSDVSRDELLFFLDTLQLLFYQESPIILRTIFAESTVILTYRFTVDEKQLIQVADVHGGNYCTHFR